MASHTGSDAAGAVSRRGFLGTAAAAGGALALDWALAGRVHAAGSATLKVGLIGCGKRGTGAAEQALSTAGPVTLWACGDAFADRIEDSLGYLVGESPVAKRVDVPAERRFAGLDAYRKVIESGVDVVILTGPPGFRPAHFAAAVAAGKHVFMEKPVATDAPGIREVLAAAEEAKKKNLKVAVGLQRRYDPGYQETVRRIREGAIGDLLLLRAYWDGDRAAKVPPPRAGLTEMQYQVRNWYYFAWLSGDHIAEQHVHNLDVCNWVKGAHPVEAQGQGGRQVRTGREYGNIFDHHVVEFTYADGSKMFSQCRQIPGCWGQVGEQAAGTKGWADIGKGLIQSAGAEPWRWKLPRDRKDAGSNPYQIEHDVLFDAIRNDKPQNDAGHAAIATMTAILGRMATYSGQLVTWDDAIRSERSLGPDVLTWDATPKDLPGPDGFYPVARPGETKVL